MSDRCRNRECRSMGARQSANMMPSTQNGTPNCRGEYPQNGNTTKDRSLQKRLQELDFSIVDTVLYLDAYPHCHKALEYYHKLVAERDALLEEMAKQGTPVTNFENASRKSWDWTNGPWPWELDAN